MISPSVVAAVRRLLRMLTHGVSAAFQLVIFSERMFPLSTKVCPRAELWTFRPQISARKEGAFSFTVIGRFQMVYFFPLLPFFFLRDSFPPRKLSNHAKQRRPLMERLSSDEMSKAWYQYYFRYMFATLLTNRIWVPQEGPLLTFISLYFALSQLRHYFP